MQNEGLRVFQRTVLRFGSVLREMEALTPDSRSSRCVRCTEFWKAVFRRTVLIACVSCVLYPLAIPEVRCVGLGTVQSGLSRASFLQRRWRRKQAYLQQSKDGIPICSVEYERNVDGTPQKIQRTCNDFLKVLVLTEGTIKWKSNGTDCISRVFENFNQGAEFVFRDNGESTLRISSVSESGGAALEGDAAGHLNLQMTPSPGSQARVSCEKEEEWTMVFSTVTIDCSYAHVKLYLKNTVGPKA